MAAPPRASTNPVSRDSHGGAGAVAAFDFIRS
jgi:hypothetical protein